MAAAVGDRGEKPSEQHAFVLGELNGPAVGQGIAHWMAAVPFRRCWIPRTPSRHRSASAAATLL